MRNSKFFPSLDFKPSQPIPTLMNVYGGFASPVEPKFLPERMVWLNNFHGMIVDTHVRGGGELGMHWYEEGRASHKMNSVNDLIGAAEFLIAKGYTDSKHLAIEGGSNGGMMTVAAVNKRPELFGCVFSRVPVTDMLRYTKFTIGDSWVSEYGFSGDPN